MTDKVINMGKSILQHGEYNERIYLMKLHNEDFPHIIKEMDRLASIKGYTKIFAKIPYWAKDKFLSEGYREEAFIPGFYNGNMDAVFMGKYFDGIRGCACQEDKIKEVLEAAESKQPQDYINSLKPEFSYRIADINDVGQMAQVYKKTFKTYPFPIHDPDYLLQTMGKNLVYFGVWKDNKLVAISSSETDIEYLNAEMTDFAVLPKCRGNNMACFLLEKMEEEMKRRSIITAYTIARSVSYGMNIAFKKMGYSYCGTLINNTNISGNLESMNVWYKRILV